MSKPKNKNASRSVFPLSRSKKESTKFKSVSLSVASDGDGFSSSSDESDSDNDITRAHDKNTDNYLLESAKLMRNIAKFTSDVKVFDDGDDDADFDSYNAVSIKPSNAAGKASAAGGSADDDAIISQLEKDLNFDVEFDEDGLMKTSTLSGPAPPRQLEESPSKEDDYDRDNVSDEGSDISFGGGGLEEVGFGSDGVPLEKYNALSAKMVALMNVTKTHKKEFKALRKKHKKADSELTNVKQERDELEQEVEEMQVKYEEALQKGGTGGGGGGGRAGAGGAALEEQRRKQREDARKALFAGGEEDDDVDFHVKLEDMGFLREIFIRLTKYINKKMPLSADIRTIQGHFGSSVASFFSFYRWIIITNVWASVLCVIFLIHHLYSLHNRKYSDTWKMYNSLPAFMAISSYETNKANPEIDDRYHYLALILLLPAILFFDAIRKWIHEDANSKVINSIEAEQANIKFAKQVRSGTKRRREWKQVNPRVKAVLK